MILTYFLLGDKEYLSWRENRLYITSEVLYAENPPGYRGKIPQKREGKIRDYSWKEKSASTIKRILSLAFYGGGRILHAAQDTTTGNYELSFSTFILPPPFRLMQ